MGVRNSSFPLHWPLAYSSPCSFGLIHTLCSKKGRHQTHCCKSVNSNQHFNFFFSVRFSSKFAANDLLRIPLHLICVAILPCGILMSEKERQSPTNVVHTHTHTRLTALFPGLPRWAGTGKVKPIWILLKKETVSGSGISWVTCKSASRSRQTGTPAPHHSVFYRPDALPAAQPTASKHWRHN